MGEAEIKYTKVELHDFIECEGKRWFIDNLTLHRGEGGDRLELHATIDTEEEEI